MWLTSGRSASALVANEFSEVVASRQASEELGSESRAVGLMATSALALALVLALVGCSTAEDDDDAPLGAAAVAAVAAAAVAAAAAAAAAATPVTNIIYICMAKKGS